jgi:flagellar basal body-associated protein FliL
MKKISLDLIVVAVAGLLLVAGLTLSYMAFFKIQPIFISDSAEKKNFIEGEINAQNAVNFYTLPKVQTNIEQQNSRLIQAEMTVVLEPEKDTTVEELKTMESKIIDLIISTVSQSTFEQLDNVSSKIILAEKIKLGTNEIMKKRSVKNVLFSTFSVQLQ